MSARCIQCVVGGCKDSSLSPVLDCLRCCKGAIVTATYLTFVETCKLMAMALLDFFRGFFDMIVAGRRDYALMTEALLVKPV